MIFCGCEAFFNDRRAISGVLLLWTILSCAVFYHIMVQDKSKFLNIGPSAHNTLFGVVLDSWFKWWAVAIYTFVSTAIAAFASDSIAPWITNTIQDHKTRYIPYQPFTCWMIIQIFTMYAVTQSTIGLFVALTQVDFTLIRLGADMIVNHFTTYWFLHNKECDAERYYQEQQHKDNDTHVERISEQTEMDTLVT